MSKIWCILILGALTGLSSMSLSAQLSDFGTVGTISLSKDIYRNVGVSVEQELRFDQLSTSLNRSATSFGVDFALVRRFVSAQIDYDLLYRRNNDAFYEFRHRSSLGLLVQYKCSGFNYRFRTRMQTTYKIENHGGKTFYPRYVWRNKLELRHPIFGSPLAPYLYGEMFCPINSIDGFYMDGYRVVLGTRYKVSKRNDIDFQLRFDQKIQQANPKNILYCCVGWDYKL